MEITLKIDKELGKKPKNTRYRQLLADVLFVFENAVFVCFGILCGDTHDVYPLNQDGGYCRVLLYGVFIFSCNLVGLFLKIVYYKFFHIWKELAMSAHEGKMKMKELKYDIPYIQQLESEIEVRPFASKNSFIVYH